MKETNQLLIIIGFGGFEQGVSVSPPAVAWDGCQLRPVGDTSGSGLKLDGGWWIRKNKKQ